jgi:hypothetical protein
MQTKFWYVFKRGGGAPSYRHPTYNSAVEEAQRLVDDLGGEYEILECQSIVKAAPRWIVEPTQDAGLISKEQDPQDCPF